MTDENAHNLVEVTAELAAAYLSNNKIETARVPELIAAIHSTLAGLGSAAPSAEPEKPQRPIGVRASIKPDRLISMIDGKSYKTLRRHLAQHGLTPAQYRERYDLPSDYPMVASAYSETRRALAKAIGLGRKAADKVGQAAEAVEAKVEEVVKPRRGRKPAAKPEAAAPAKRGRKPKAVSGTEALAKARGRKRATAAAPEA